MTGIGVFGGTFDPVHIAHLVTAAEVRHALGLEKVLLVVANDPWQKSGRVVAPAAARFAMVEAAVAGIDGLEADPTELERGGPSYMADTLAALSRRLGVTPLFLVLGADVAALLDTWERPEEVRALATVVVVRRPGVDPPSLSPGWRVREVEVPSIDLSSKWLRERLAAGQPVDWLIPAPALTVIRERGLYGDRGTSVPTTPDPRSPR